ncbi:hypothetical protein QWY90_01565 [Flavobacterium paronense]|nr:hypothetical protein [Flavobacterium paronense]MDN3675996.1 hypothetical protein [Flavobacterium paronense]
MFENSGTSEYFSSFTSPKKENLISFSGSKTITLATSPFSVTITK